MIALRIALAAALVAAAASAQSQGRISSFEPNSSMTFHQYIEPFPKFGNAEACRDTCIANPRCSGWTWYDESPSHPEILRTTCILGTGLKDSVIGRAPGRTAGLIRAARASSFEPNSSMTFHRYLEPFPRFDNPEACRDACVGNPQCTGWTWYDASPSHPQQLRQICIMGNGLKDALIGRAPGRTAGQVSGP